MSSPHFPDDASTPQQPAISPAGPPEDTGAVSAMPPNAYPPLPGVYYAPPSHGDRLSSSPMPNVKTLVTIIVEMIPGGVGPYGIGDIATLIEGLLGRTIDGLLLTGGERLIYFIASLIPIVPARPFIALYRRLHPHDDVNISKYDVPSALLQDPDSASSSMHLSPLEPGRPMGQAEARMPMQPQIPPVQTATEATGRPVAQQPNPARSTTKPRPGGWGQTLAYIGLIILILAGASLVAWVVKILVSGAMIGIFDNVATSWGIGPALAILGLIVIGFFILDRATKSK